MSSQGREHSIGNGRTAHHRHILHQMRNQLRQLLRHGWRQLVGIIVLVLADHRHLVTSQFDGTLHDLRHHLVLSTLASRVDGATPFVVGLAIGRQDCGNPVRIVIAHIAQISSHREDEVVARTMSWNTAKQFLQTLNQKSIRNSVKSLIECLVGQSIILLRNICFLPCFYQRSFDLGFWSYVQTRRGLCHILKQTLIVDVQEILFRHAERQSCKILGTGIDIFQPERLHIGCLCSLNVKTFRHWQHYAQTVGRRSDMSNERTMGKALILDLIPQLARVIHMVDVDHDKPRRMSRVVLALAIVKPRMPAESRQTALETRDGVGVGSQGYLIADSLDASVGDNLLEGVLIDHRSLASDTLTVAELKHRVSPFCPK